MDRVVTSKIKQLAMERNMEEVITMLQKFHITPLYPSLDVLQIHPCPFQWGQFEEMGQNARPVEEVTGMERRVDTTTDRNSKTARFATKSTYEPPVKIPRYNDQCFAFVGDIIKLEDLNLFMKQRSFVIPNFNQFSFDGKSIPFSVRDAQEVVDANEINLSEGSFGSNTTTTQSVDENNSVWNEYNANFHSEPLSSGDDIGLYEEYNRDRDHAPWLDEDNDFQMILNACRERHWSSPD
ncbi:unnamed protein product [Orchesella dallaii]|uniref:Uncharacterized protein n=1 Tax=Orchesella dallaii TaxID=48710 RepID=A0ABP1Q5H0_9HEXA